MPTRLVLCPSWGALCRFRECINSVKSESTRFRNREMMASESDSLDARSGRMRSFKLLNNVFITYIAF